MLQRRFVFKIIFIILKWAAIKILTKYLQKDPIRVVGCFLCDNFRDMNWMLFFNFFTIAKDKNAYMYSFFLIFWNQAKEKNGIIILLNSSLKTKMLWNR